ncbi:probable inactive ATP-dependent zinc metalloprotease FTSHI 1, chloroplastic [Selaginella moellendorffii]|uniref:probable inactive ATP-dependent zinc metalloprotease FTSHI 1, chloroplastic n=1 Tax=Selaginella moellendorffii TaxID=88036 RepID=UPI000D1C8604|nr:probable inactive ATP-dependent zinc metalloprotease FTSHI 1, chloroplastic [Selaginella moellendorffii]|eukprot:XP_024522811.1 probable inactive ATP-dependent zinc metalloprotease FTSHI 1, chloroplastic [Selaginella moellendorffii]
MAMAMALSSSREPRAPLRDTYTGRRFQRRHWRRISAAQASDDFMTQILRENPSRVERKCLSGDRMLSLKEWRLQRVPLWSKLLAKIEPLVEKAREVRPQEKKTPETTSQAAKGRSVFLPDLLRAYKGNLYVPEEIFMGHVAEAEEFAREFAELPVMIFQDFVNVMQSDQVAQIKSKGTQFIVELKELSGERSAQAQKWSMQLTEAQAKYVLSQYRGYHHEIQPRFAPTVIQPPPTPNPVSSAISNRLMLELSTVVSLISVAAFAVGKFAAGAASALASVAAFVIFRVLLPTITPIMGPFLSLTMGVVRIILGTGEAGMRTGLLGLFTGFTGFVTSGDLLSALRIIISMIFVIVMMAAFAKFTITRRSRDHQKWDIWQAIEFGQSKPQARVKGSTGVMFKDVAGIDEVVKELQELVVYLKDPERFARMGTKPPHGVLLEGPPGCGKTLLAKAVAGEAGVPFYQMAGSEFVEVLVGVGAARMRDLFLRAKVNRPAVVFIDEIDALGGARSEFHGKRAMDDKTATFHAGTQERETTLNQLLIELDGFDTGKGVIFLGATNRADMLDPALLRPGRFDRRILISPPKASARYEILKVHSEKVKLDSSVDLWPYAKSLNGWSGAELAQLMQESALVAIRKGHKSITRHDVDTAVDRLTIGPEVYGVGRRQSVHRRLASIEIGMAMVAHLLRSTENAEVEPCDRISIVPRGKTYSRTIYHTLDDDAYLFARRPTLIHRLKVMLGARIGEELIYGHDTSTLSAAYLADASWLARKIFSIWNVDGRISMHGERSPWERSSQFGPPTWFEGGLYNDYDLVGQSIDPRMDEDVAVRTKALMEKAYDETLSLLKPYKAALTKALHVIMEKEEMFGEELDVILKRYPSGYQVELVDSEEQPGYLVSDSSDTKLVLELAGGSSKESAWSKNNDTMA